MTDQKTAMIVSNFDGLTATKQYEGRIAADRLRAIPISILNQRGSNMDFGEIVTLLSKLPKLLPFPAEAKVAMSRGGKLQTCLDPLSSDSLFSGMGIAVIDLNKMAYAGVRDDIQLYGASLVKIVAMFAAFALRESVRNAESVLPKMDRVKLFKLLTGMWKPTVETSVSQKHKDFPKFLQIFATTGIKIDFNQDFKKRMDLMMTLSDNHGAAECIQRLGYQYINGALAAAGLFKTTGLWLGADYVADVKGYKDFEEINLDPAATKGIHDPKGKTTQGATAETVAKLLATVELGTLVSSEASAEMKAIMLRQRLESDFKKTLSDRYGGVISYGKVGVGYGVGDDCAVIERTATVQPAPKVDKRLKYVAVGLREPIAYHLKKLIIKLDDCVVANNAP